MDSPLDTLVSRVERVLNQDEVTSEHGKWEVHESQWDHITDTWNFRLNFRGRVINGIPSTDDSV